MPVSRSLEIVNSLGIVERVLWGKETLLRYSLDLKLGLSGNWQSICFLTQRGNDVFPELKMKECLTRHPGVKNAKAPAACSYITSGGCRVCLVNLKEA